MEINKKEELTDNRKANLITDLNLEVKMFLDKFSSFRKEYNITDINLVNNLQMVYDEINKFINGNPTNVHTEDRTNIDLKVLKQNGILKLYVCDICKLEVGDRSRDILRHIDYYPTHPKTRSTRVIAKQSSSENNSNNNESKNAAKKEAKKKKKERQDNKIIEKKLPKKAKQFIFNDFGIFLDKAFQIGKKLMEIPEYKLIEKNLYDSLKPTFPDMRIHFFGSRINGLSNINSDLDVFLDVGNIYHTYQKKSNENKKINKVEDLLRKNFEWKHFQSIKKARVPILRAFFVTDKFKIDCDISFSHGLGHLNTLLMRYLFDLQPICHKMCLFLKQWIKTTNLNDLVSTYSFVLLAVYFLQVKNLLPSIKLLQEGITTPIEIGPWQGDFIEKSLNELKIEKVEASNKKCFEFLRDFFKFYSEFKFDSLIVCPYLGRPISKSNLHDSELENIPRYANFYLIDPKENAFQINKPICVMDPLELNHNVAKGISDKFLLLMKHYWMATYEELANPNRETAVKI